MAEPITMSIGLSARTEAKRDPTVLRRESSGNIGRAGRVEGPIALRGNRAAFDLAHGRISTPPSLVSVAGQIEVVLPSRSCRKRSRREAGKLTIALQFETALPCSVSRSASEKLRRRRCHPSKRFRCRVMSATVPSTDMRMSAGGWPGRRSASVPPNRTGRAGAL